MFIYSNGCSHTEKNFKHDGYISLISDYFFGYEIKPTIVQSLEYLFGGKSEQIQDNVVNRLITTDNGIVSTAYSGKSNQIICLETIEYISKCISNNIKPDYVIIQFTGPNRRMIIKPDVNNYIWFDCNLYDGLDHVDLEPLASISSLMNILQLQEFLKNNNIDYTFLCYHELDASISKLASFNFLDLTKFTIYSIFIPDIFG